MPHSSNDTDEHRQPGDRRRIALNDVAMIVGLMIQLAAIVWGASALKSSVDSLRETMAIMTAQIHETQAVVNSLSVDVGKMSVDVGNLKDRVNKK